MSRLADSNPTRKNGKVPGSALWADRTGKDRIGHFPHAEATIHRRLLEEAKCVALVHPITVDKDALRALDLLLPRFFAGLPVDVEFLAGLGYGGLLNAGMQFRFPPYGRRLKPAARPSTRSG